MSENSKIQWTDHTFNPWRGRANCYAETLSKRNPGALGIWGPTGTRVLASEAMWREPVKWNRAAQVASDAWGIASYTATDERLIEAGFVKPTRPRVFCASLADVFEDYTRPLVNSRGREVGFLKDDWNLRSVTLDDARARLFRLIDSTPNLDWLLLTKRPENVRRRWTRPGWSSAAGDACYCDKRHNVWLGCSIANQEDADRNIPELLKCRDLCAKLFVSVEPLIGPVNLDLNRMGIGKWSEEPQMAGIDWIVVGGESGPHARPCNVEWIRSIVRQCRAAGVPCFVKQLGAVPFTPHPGIEWTEFDSVYDDVLEFVDAKGGDPSEWPEDLRVREFPAKGGE